MLDVYIVYSLLILVFFAIAMLLLFIYVIFNTALTREALQFHCILDMQ